MKRPWLAPAASKPAPYRFFINGPVDFLCLGGLSLIVFGALGLIERRYGVQNAWIGHAATLSWLCNWPHFAATNYRLYHSRTNIAQYPLTALLLPLLLLGATLASFASPLLVAPLFVKVFLIWSPYHYSGQSVGISLIYAKRAGFVFGRIERAALAGFIFGTFILQTALGEVGTQIRPFYGINPPSLGLPQLIADVMRALMWGSGGIFLACVARWSLKNRRWMPVMIFLPATAQFVWFVLGWRVQTFYNFVPFFHGLQYLLIAWAMQLKETMDEHHIAPSSRYVVAETLRWTVGIFIGGGILFWVLPRVGTWWGFDLQIAEPIIISAVQIHHFFVDGVIWKLRNPKVGSPLLINLDQLRLARTVRLQPV